MKSWKFGLVFPVFLLLGNTGEWLYFDLESDTALLFASLILFMILFIVKMRAVVGTIICAGIFFADLICFIWGIKNGYTFRMNYVHYGLWVKWIIIAFTLITVIKKWKDILALIRKFLLYIAVFVFLYMFYVLLGGLHFNSMGWNNCSYFILSVFIIFAMYVFLTMWWHPGYYYRDTSISHRFDIFASDYRKIHTENVKGLSGKDSDFFTIYKLKEISSFIENSEHFLDFGCGDGNTAKYFTDLYSDKDYIGIDVSEESINKASELKNEKCLFKVYDGKSIPYGDEYFDVIFMACVLHHISLEDRENVLNECFRVLKPKGKLIIFEHNPWNILTCNTVDKCPFDEDAILLSPIDSAIKVFRVGFSKIGIRFTLFIPRKGVFNRIVWIEQFLKWCPIGAQYYLVAEK